MHQQKPEQVSARSHWGDTGDGEAVGVSESSEELMGD